MQRPDPKHPLHTGISAIRYPPHRLTGVGGAGILACMPERRDWTDDEHLLAFRLYRRLPFGRLHYRNPEIVELAKLIDRPVGGVASSLAQRC